MLRFEKITLNSAKLGPNNPIPDITGAKDPLWFVCDESVSKKESELIGCGMIASVLPYKVQNLYNRDLQPREYAAAVLENEHLKAVFLPEFGGRLWSLYDKKLQKDIIYKNDALIFGNLALRNAWFAGGVEWNVGIRGHSHFTCAPLFTQKVIGKQGNDILRMYEYEEIRGLVYCLEATLDGDALLMNMTVKNTRQVPTYMYWWSNIAVEQKKGTRFFVPADRSFVTSYRDSGFCISKVDIPYLNGKDTSDPYHPWDAIDYFYDIPDENKKWISSIEEDGKGLLQYSDHRLFGRKVFLWGKIPGGQHWNQWLTHGRDYYEIQAGLCKTQFEHFLIGPEEELCWNEVYRGIDIGSNQGDYFDICNKIDGHVPAHFDFSQFFTAASVFPPVIMGRGKGFLFEKLLGIRFHEKCSFPIESVGSREQYYLDLLEGRSTAGDEHTDFICGKEWRAFLESQEPLTAFDRYILALICYRDADYDAALDYLTQSVSEKETYYSLTALALLTSNIFGKHREALSCMHQAILLAPDSLPVAVKYGELAIKCQNYSAFLQYYEKAVSPIRENGRIRMYAGQCLVETGELEKAKALINDKLVVEDFKEGEYSVSAIWINLYRQELAKSRNCSPEDISDDEVLSQYPLPYSIDFRMHEPTKGATL